MYAPRIKKTWLHWRTIIVTIAVCGVLVAGSWYGIAKLGQRSPLPPSIAQHIQFPVFIPSGLVLDGRSYKYDRQSGVLSFTATLGDAQSVTFAEQAAPASFTDIPGFYNQFLQKLFEYQAFDCLNGTMYLTHPKGAGQAAVMSSKGTLLFARVANDEQTTTWRQLCNGLVEYTW